MGKIIKSIKSQSDDNCCGKQIKKSERKTIVYKKTIKRK